MRESKCMVCQGVNQIVKRLSSLTLAELKKIQMALADGFLPDGFETGMEVFDEISRRLERAEEKLAACTDDNWANINWANLVKKYDPLIGDRYLDEKGVEYSFIGLLHGLDDFYFVMWREKTVRLLTCVGVPEQMGFMPSN